MITDSIANDDPQKLPVFSPDGSFSLDYAGFGNAAEIDRGIRETIKGIRFSILTIGLGLARIKVNGFFRILGFPTMSQYIERLCDDIKMERTCIFNWLYIGEAYIKYQNELGEIGFCDDDGPTKLPYLERALEYYEKQEVFSNIKTMSVREFTAFSKGVSGKDAAPGPYVTVKRGRVYVDGRLAVKINRRLDKKSYLYFRKLLRIAGMAMEEGEFILPVRLQNMDEVRRYEQASGRLINNLRKNV